MAWHASNSFGDISDQQIKMYVLMSDFTLQFIEDFLEYLISVYLKFYKESLVFYAYLRIKNVK